MQFTGQSQLCFYLLWTARSTGRMSDVVAAVVDFLFLFQSPASSCFYQEEVWLWQNQLQFGTEPGWHLERVIPLRHLSAASKSPKTWPSQRRWGDAVNRWGDGLGHPFANNEGFVYVNFKQATSPPQLSHISLSLLASLGCWATGWKVQQLVWSPEQRQVSRWAL